MKNIKLALASVALFAAFCNIGYSAALVTISVDTGTKSLQDINGVALSGGAAAINGDGTAVQIGYYTNSTVAAPFGTGLDADFVPLIGSGSQFGLSLFSIGDQATNGAANGEIFADGLNIFTGVNDALLPVAGTPLVMRFHNAATLGGSNQFIALANTTFWLWKTPANAPSQPLISLSLDDAGLIGRSKEGGLRDGRAFVPVNVTGSSIMTQSALAVPEPSSMMLLSFLGLIASSRRTRK